MADSYNIGGYRTENVLTGGLVDRKGYNMHISGLPDITANIVAAGTPFGTLGATGEIPAGAIVMDSGSCATLAGGSTTGTVGKFNIAKGAAGEILLGVSVDTREGNDARPLTVTWFGFVRLLAGNTTVTKGDFIKACADSSNYGCATTWISNTNATGTNAETNANVLANEKLKIGKALTSADAGKPFDAFVNFSGV